MRLVMRHAWTILVAVLLAPTFPSFAQIRLGGWEVEATVSYSVYDRGTGLNAEIVDHDYSQTDIVHLLYPYFSSA